MQWDCECGGGQDPRGAPGSTDLPQRREQLKGVVLCWERHLVAPTESPSKVQDLSPGGFGLGFVHSLWFFPHL